jgi:hypothetical protein
MVDQRHAVLLAVEAPVSVAHEPVERRHEVDHDVVAAVQVGHGLRDLAPPVSAVQVVAAHFVHRDEVGRVAVDHRSRLVDRLAERVARLRHAAVAQIHLDDDERRHRSGRHRGHRRCRRYDSGHDGDA